MIRKLNFLLIIIFISAALTGCWDFEDANKKSFILSVGIDKVDDNTEFTGEATAFVFSKGGKDTQSQQSQQSFFQYSGIGKDFESARINVDQEVTHNFYLGETRTVIFGSECAKDEIASYISRIDNLYDYRKTLIIAVSREPAKEILSNPSNRNIGTGFYVENNIKILTKNSQAIYTDFKDMLPYKRIEGTGFLLPYIGIDRGTIRYLGVAVMKNYKMADTIKINDMDGIILLLNKKPVLQENLSLEDNKNRVFLKAYMKSRKIKTDYKNDAAIINIDFNLDASLQYMYFPQKIDDDTKMELQSEISQKIKNDILKVIDKSQNEFACDVFYFAKYFRAQHPKIFKTINWQDKYINAKINVNVKTKIINTNLKDTTAKSSQ